jgi:hypothetical protein
MNTSEKVTPHIGMGDVGSSPSLTTQQTAEYEKQKIDNRRSNKIVVGGEFK